MQLSKPIRFKQSTNRDLVTCVFPRCENFFCFISLRSNRLHELFSFASVGWKALLIKKKKKAQKHACSTIFFVDIIESNSLCKGVVLYGQRAIQLVTLALFSESKASKFEHILALVGNYYLSLKYFSCVWSKTFRPSAAKLVRNSVRG